MKSKRLLFSVLFLLGLLAQAWSAILVTPSEGPYYVGQHIGFRLNCSNPGDCSWFWGDGAVLSMVDDAPVWRYHTYQKAGTYQIHVRRYPFSTPICATDEYKTIVIEEEEEPQILYTPAAPLVEDLVQCTVVGWSATAFDWNLGDGYTANGAAATISHRYLAEGTYTISVSASAGQRAGQPRPARAVTRPITILPDNRSVTVSSAQAMINQSVTFTALNFKSDSIRWNFGDDTPLVIGGNTVTHAFARPGEFRVRARDYGINSQKVFHTTIKVMGITDDLLVEVMELAFDNGKYYQVVPKNLAKLRATLRMKMRGTGIVSGYWVVDGRPFEYFNEVAHQGHLESIPTRPVPGLPTVVPGMHTLTIQLTRPSDVAIEFPVLRYMVLPYENLVELLTPADGFVARDKSRPTFSWGKAYGASSYEIVFSESLLSLFDNAKTLQWQANKGQTSYEPPEELWNALKRNQWTYWKVRALTGIKQVIAESPIQEFKVILAAVDITLKGLSDLEGNEIRLQGERAESRARDVMVRGELRYEGIAKYVVLRVYVDDELVDQLLFRDVGRDDLRAFETVIPNAKPATRVVFQALSSNSPSVIVGIQELTLSRPD